ncbi:protein FAM163A-like [Anolis sagrei]|uniref:protein FAM163A-like n=1 Tax=Anolis sagrei TaxID=38937 RepID=UPI00295B4DA6|nr:protein FAM163A-like [Anolis sagrei ordinatus]
MTAGTVVITGGILATVILLCIIAVLCYCRLQYYCCKKDESDEEEEEEEEEEEGEGETDLPPHSHYVMCNACNSRIMDGQGNPSFPPHELNKQGTRNYCPTCSPSGSPFYIRTADMVRNGGERITYTPMCCKEMGLPIKMATFQSYPVTHHCIIRETFTNPRAFSTEV